MNTICPTCKGRIVMHAFPPSRDPRDPNEAWLCNLGCDAAICVHCYVKHNEKIHPKIYEPQH